MKDIVNFGVNIRKPHLRPISSNCLHLYLVSILILVIAIYKHCEYTIPATYSYAINFPILRIFQIYIVLISKIMKYNCQTLKQVYENCLLFFSL